MNNLVKQAKQLGYLDQKAARTVKWHVNKYNTQEAEEVYDATRSDLQNFITQNRGKPSQNIADEAASRLIQFQDELRILRNGGSDELGAAGSTRQIMQVIADEVLQGHTERKDHILQEMALTAQTDQIEATKTVTKNMTKINDAIKKNPEVKQYLQIMTFGADLVAPIQQQEATTEREQINSADTVLNAPATKQTLDTMAKVFRGIQRYTQNPEITRQLKDAEDVYKKSEFAQSLYNLSDMQSTPEQITAVQEAILKDPVFTNYYNQRARHIPQRETRASERARIQFNKNVVTDYIGYIAAGANTPYNEQLYNIERNNLIEQLLDVKQKNDENTARLAQAEQFKPIKAAKISAFAQRNMEIDEGEAARTELLNSFVKDKASKTIRKRGPSTALDEEEKAAAPNTAPVAAAIAENQSSKLSKEDFKLIRKYAHYAKDDKDADTASIKISNKRKNKGFNKKTKKQQQQPTIGPAFYRQDDEDDPMAGVFEPEANILKHMDHIPLNIDDSFSIGLKRSSANSIASPTNNNSINNTFNNNVNQNFDRPPDGQIVIPQGPANQQLAGAYVTLKNDVLTMKADAPKQDILAILDQAISVGTELSSKIDTQGANSKVILDEFNSIYPTYTQSNVNNKAAVNEYFQSYTTGKGQFMSQADQLFSNNSTIDALYKLRRALNDNNWDKHKQNALITNINILENSLEGDRQFDDATLFVQNLLDYPEGDGPINSIENLITNLPKIPSFKLQEAAQLRAVRSLNQVPGFDSELLSHAIENSVKDPLPEDFKNKLIQIATEHKADKLRQQQIADNTISPMLQDSIYLSRNDEEAKSSGSTLHQLLPTAQNVQSVIDLTEQELNSGGPKITSQIYQSSNDAASQFVSTIPVVNLLTNPDTLTQISAHEDSQSNSRSGGGGGTLDVFNQLIGGQIRDSNEQQMEIQQQQNSSSIINTSSQQIFSVNRKARRKEHLGEPHMTIDYLKYYQDGEATGFAPGEGLKKMYGDWGKTQEQLTEQIFLVDGLNRQIEETKQQHAEYLEKIAAEQVATVEQLQKEKEDLDAQYAEQQRQNDIERGIQEVQAGVILVKRVEEETQKRVAKEMLEMTERAAKTEDKIKKLSKTITDANGKVLELSKELKDAKITKTEQTRLERRILSLKQKNDRYERDIINETKRKLEDAAKVDKKIAKFEAEADERVKKAEEKGAVQKSREAQLSTKLDIEKEKGTTSLSKKDKDLLIVQEERGKAGDKDAKALEKKNVDNTAKIELKKLKIEGDMNKAKEKHTFEAEESTKKNAHQIAKLEAKKALLVKDKEIIIQKQALERNKQTKSNNEVAISNNKVTESWYKLNNQSQQMYLEGAKLNVKIDNFNNKAENDMIRLKYEIDAQNRRDYGNDMRKLQIESAKATGQFDRQINAQNAAHQLQHQKDFNDIVKMNRAKDIEDELTEVRVSQQEMMDYNRHVQKMLRDEEKYLNDKDFQVDAKSLLAQKITGEESKIDKKKEANVAQHKAILEEEKNQNTDKISVIKEKVSGQKDVLDKVNTHNTNERILDRSQEKLLTESKVKVQENAVIAKKEIAKNQIDHQQKLEEIRLKSIRDDEEARRRLMAKNAYYASKAKRIELHDNVYREQVTKILDRYAVGMADAAGMDESLKSFQKGLDRKKWADENNGIRHVNDNLYDIKTQFQDPAAIKSKAMRATVQNNLNKFQLQAHQSKQTFDDEMRNQSAHTVIHEDFYLQMTQLDDTLKDAAAFNQRALPDQKAALNQFKTKLVEPYVKISRAMARDVFVDPYPVIEVAQISKILQDLMDKDIVRNNDVKSMVANIIDLNNQVLYVADKHNRDVGADLHQEAEAMAAIFKDADLEEERVQKQHERVEKMQNSVKQQLNEKLEKLGLNNSQSPFGIGGLRGGGGGSGQSNPYSGKLGKQRYINERTREVFTSKNNNNNASEGGGGTVQIGSNTLRLANRDRHVSEEDIQLLKQVIIDRETGFAMKRGPNGEAVEFSDEEKERLAYVIIEMCLFVYSKHIKVASKRVLDTFRQQIKANLGTTDDSLMPLVKVINAIANKLSSGNIQKATISKYINALASKKQQQQPSHRENADDQMNEEE